MAKSRKSKSSTSRAGEIDLTTHRLVAKLHPEPDAPRDAVALLGYIGPSKEADRIRLYADLSFRRYCDIPTSGIVHTEPTDTRDENSPTVVFVRATTVLDVVETTCQCVEASYLQGPIARNYLADASVEGLRSAANPGGAMPLREQTRHGGGFNAWAGLGYTCGAAGTICMSCVRTYPVCRPR